MTATQQFIEDAIKGGWLSVNKPFIDKSETNWVTVGFDSVTDNVIMWHHEILLDPLAWQAVGKTRGWELVEGNNWRWKLKWTSFFNHLADGKAIEKALSSI